MLFGVSVTVVSDFTGVPLALLGGVLVYFFVRFGAAHQVDAEKGEEAARAATLDAAIVVLAATMAAEKADADAESG